MPESLEEFIAQRVRIEYRFPENLSSHFASQIVAQFQQDHFIVSFFEVFPPPLLAETDQEKIAALKALDHVDAKCVARIIVTPAKMQELVQLLAENLANYQLAMKDVTVQKGQI